MMHIKNVLVPVDFSPPSRLAVNYGICLARTFRARLTLMHVVESPKALRDSAGNGSAQVEKQYREQAERMLAALLGPEDQDDLDFSIVLKSGGIEAEIIAAASEQGADMLVMGTHGRGLFGRLLIGSVTQNLLRKAAIPILTICHVTRPLALERILFAAGLSETSKHGLDFAINLARQTHSKLVFLHATERATLAYGGNEMVCSVTQEDAEEARAKLAALAAESTGQGVQAETILVEGDAAQEIIKGAEDANAGLILITVQFRGLVERTLLGTTAERLIREARVPVLSIPVNPTGRTYK